MLASAAFDTQFSACYFNFWLGILIVMTMQKTSRCMATNKRIALVAHDHMKSELISWAGQRVEILNKHHLFGTGTTAKLLTREVGLPVKALFSGPMGGDRSEERRVGKEC